MQARPYLLAILLLVVASTADPAVASAGEAASAAETGQSDRALVHQMVARARELGLGDSREWRALMHTEDPLFGSVRSSADGASFFVDPNGKEDLAAELEATLEGIWALPEGADSHTVCRFPARFLFLSRALGIRPDTVPQPSCPKLLAFVERAGGLSVRLIFSSYFLNNPASAFGHTFLRLGRLRTPTAVPDDLLDAGVDFAATVGDENALVYAFKGLTGLYPGVFKVLPYFYKVREYNDFESRDLWEYELAFDEAERRLLVFHLWELGTTYFDYFYLSENCSFVVLAALHAAKPDAGLLDRIHWPVLPIDTVRAVASVPGLVRSVRLRPSMRSTFRARIADLQDDDLSLVGRLQADAQAKLPEAELSRQAQILDAAIDLAAVNLARALAEEARDTPAHRHKQALLERRAALPYRTPALAVGTPPPRPESGHGSIRAGAAIGADDTGSGEIGMSFRLALHDLADPGPEFPALTGIEFLPTRLRVTPAENRWVLEELMLVRVTSFTAIDRFQATPSWHVSLGAVTPDLGAGGETPVGQAELGGGFTVGTSRQGFSLFALGDVRLQVDPAGAEGPWARLGLGPELGFKVIPLPDAAFVARGQWLHHAWQASDSDWLASAELRWLLEQNLAISFAHRRSPGGGHSELALYGYF